MTPLRIVVAVGLLMQAGAAMADTAWVSDRLKAGLHAEPTASSTVLTLLPAGTEVEVLERDGSVVYVVTADGVEGWLDAQYLSDERPAVLLLADAGMELEAANGRIAELESDLSAARQATAEAAEGGPEVRSASFDAPINSETLRELQRVAEENQRLKQQLAESDAAAEMALERLELVSAEPVAEPPQTPAAGASYGHYLYALRDWSAWQWLVLASTVLLCFSLGLWSADAGVRRRHGGFRLRL